MYFVVAFLLPFSFSRPYATIYSSIFIFYLSSFILCFPFDLLSFYFYLVSLLLSAHRFPGRGCCGSGAHRGLRPHLGGHGVGDRRRETGDRREKSGQRMSKKLPSPCLFLTILFTSGAPEWERKPGHWLGIEMALLKSGC